MDGLMVDGEQIRVMSSSGQGIWKPKPIAGALSVLTAPPAPGQPPPYDDDWLDETRLAYAYERNDPDLFTNRALRLAWEHQLPLVYLYGVASGRYLAEYPVFVARDRPADLRVDLLIGGRPGEPGVAVEIDGRSYTTRPTRARLHQHGFRSRVLSAYGSRCALCSLGHASLLDAAHIVPDGEPTGLAVTPNGMALCKIHHAAYDQYFIGIRPDLVVEVNDALLAEKDGPMLRHGLQELHHQGVRVVPTSAHDKPDRDRLEWRWDRYRAHAR